MLYKRGESLRGERVHPGIIIIGNISKGVASASDVATPTPPPGVQDKHPYLSLHRRLINITKKKKKSNLVARSAGISNNKQPFSLQQEKKKREKEKPLNTQKHIYKLGKFGPQASKDSFDDKIEKKKEKKKKLVF